MFHNREDAALKLAERLKKEEFRDPLVLAIPRGGVVLGDILARELDADLDVVLSRKLRAPDRPELAVGAISEDGEVYLTSHSERFLKDMEKYLPEERRIQLEEIARRKTLIRSVLPAARVTGRSVIVTDDGIATGSTMIAALNVLREQEPWELIVAVPVASPERLGEVAEHCDRTVCLIVSEDLWAVGQFYEEFDAVEDAQMMDILRQFQRDRQARSTPHEVEQR
jgi:predicted phosphoribosyltransferase